MQPENHSLSSTYLVGREGLLGLCPRPFGVSVANATLHHEVAGEHPLSKPLQDEVIILMGFLSEDLSTNEFHALFQTDSNDEPERWINGYLKAVEIH